jgi:hypothetical protein
MRSASVAFKSVVLLLSIGALWGADKEKPFKPGPIESYPCRLTQEKVTIAAEPFDKEEETKTAFGKLNPNRYGILPMLVLIRNDSEETISLEDLRVEYITEARQRIEATPARDVAKTNSPARPRVTPGPWPGPVPRGTRNNPLNAWEIEGRAFVARMLPPGETASGFFYFQAPHRAGASLYITGLKEARSRRPLFYFEIPLDK